MGLTINDINNNLLLKMIYLRANNRSTWFCRTEQERKNKPKWVKSV